MPDETTQTGQGLETAPVRPPSMIQRIQALEQGGVAAGASIDPAVIEGLATRLDSIEAAGVAGGDPEALTALTAEVQAVRERLEAVAGFANTLADQIQQGAVEIAAIKGQMAGAATTIGLDSDGNPATDAPPA